MLLVLRTFPFLVGLVMALGAMALFWFPAQIIWVIGVALVLLFLLLARLIGWSFNKLDFWLFLSPAFFLAVAAFFLLLFLEGSGMKILVITLATFLIWLFAENLFAFLHLPRAYQVNALEHLSLVVNVVSIYFFSTALFATRLFLSAPLWLLVPIFAVVTFVLAVSTFWICKTEKERLLPNALGGTLLATELFVVLTLLPGGFFPNAALLTLFFYLFLGIVRAKLLNKLNKSILKRYLLTVALLTLIIIFTARWT